MPISIPPFSNVPAPGDPITSPWAQQITQFVVDRPLGLIAQAYGPSADLALVAGQTVDVTGATVTFTATTGRRYKVTAWAVIASGGAAGQYELFITDGANGALQNDQSIVAANLVVMHTCTYWVSTWSGSKTVKARAFSSAAGTLHGHSFRRAWIAVEDLGKP